MDKQLEERIRERAYELWMQHGSLPGRAEEYWYQAEREISGGTDEGAETQTPPIMDPAPLGMTSMTADETLSSPAAPKTRKRRSPAATPAAASPTEGTEPIPEAPVEAPKRRRSTRVT
jgi:Protein of unknown function (DUF2934)